MGKNAVFCNVFLVLWVGEQKEAKVVFTSVSI